MLVFLNQQKEFGVVVHLYVLHVVGPGVTQLLKVFPERKQQPIICIKTITVLASENKVVISRHKTLYIHILYIVFPLNWFVPLQVSKTTF